MTFQNEHEETRATHRLGRQVIDDAAEALGARRRLDGLLTRSLAAPGLDDPSLGELRAFLAGSELTRGCAALARCARLDRQDQP